MSANQTEEAAKNDPLDLTGLIVPGSFAARVDLQLGLLTQGVADCMILATGAFPGLTEGATAQPVTNYYSHRPPPAPPASGNAWQTARSAELRDAARLSEASARLLLGFARLRGTFRQDFTVRHTHEQPAGKDGGRGMTVVTQRFAVPGAGEEQTPELGADITAQLGKTVEAMAKSRGTNAAAGAHDPEELAKVQRELMDVLNGARNREVIREKKARKQNDPPQPPEQS